MEKEHIQISVMRNMAKAITDICDSDDHDHTKWSKCTKLVTDLLTFTWTL
jgi:hypothetical protein